MKRRTVISALLAAFAGCTSLPSQSTSSNTTSEQLSGDQRDVFDEYEAAQAAKQRGRSKYAEALGEYENQAYETGFDILLEGQDAFFTMEDTSETAETEAEQLANPEAVDICNQATEYGALMARAGIQIGAACNLMQQDKPDPARDHIETYREMENRAQDRQPPDKSTLVDALSK